MRKLFWCVRKQCLPLHRQKTNNRLFRLVVIDLGFLVI